MTMELIRERNYTKKAIKIPVLNSKSESSETKTEEAAILNMPKLLITKTNEPVLYCGKCKTEYYSNNSSICEVCGDTISTKDKYIENLESKLLTQQDEAEEKIEALTKNNYALTEMLAESENERVKAELEYGIDKRKYTSRILSLESEIQELEKKLAEKDEPFSKTGMVELQKDVRIPVEEYALLEFLMNRMNIYKNHIIVRDENWHPTCSAPPTHTKFAIKIREHNKIVMDEKYEEMKLAFSSLIPDNDSIVLRYKESHITGIGMNTRLSYLPDLSMFSELKSLVLTGCYEINNSVESILGSNQKEGKLETLAIYRSIINKNILEGISCFQGLKQLTVRKYQDKELPSGLLELANLKKLNIAYEELSRSSKKILKQLREKGVEVAEVQFESVR
jgi:hypothetical protein